MGYTLLNNIYSGYGGIIIGLLLEMCFFISNFVAVLNQILFMMRLNKIFLIVLAIVGAGLHGVSKSNDLGDVTVQGANVERMRFHCENDTTKINSLLMEGLHSGLSDANELVCFYAHKLEGTPYVAHTLEGDSEMLTINIDELDCTTFVETLYALTRTTMNGRYSWRDYAHHLEDLRYRRGEMGDYSSRLHYISDWIIDNSNRGNLVDVTSDIKCVRYKIKTINYMSTHRDSYPSLANDTIYEKIKNYEIGYRNHRFPYIKKESLNSKDVKAVVRRGDFVGLVTRIDGLDISHLGIVELNSEGNIVLLDASSIGKKVMLESVDLKKQLSNSGKTEGVRFFRLKDN